MGHIFCPYLWIWLSFSQVHTAHWGLMLPSCLGDFTQALYLLFFFNRPGSLLGDTRVRENWSPSKKGLPIKAKQMGEAGEVDRERLWAGCLPQRGRGSLTQQEGGGSGRKDGALEHTERGSPRAPLAGCPATVGNHLSGPQGGQGEPLLSVA